MYLVRQSYLLRLSRLLLVHYKDLYQTLAAVEGARSKLEESGLDLARCVTF